MSRDRLRKEDAGVAQVPEHSQEGSEENSLPPAPTVFPALDSVAPLTPPYQYILLHRTNSLGVAAVQAAHAAGEACFDGPAPDNTHIVVLLAQRSEEIAGIAALLTRCKIRHSLICEPDPPYDGRATALATEPSRDRERLRAIFEGFKVFR